MANTPYPLYATPLDENGNPIGNGMMMKPGGEYKFPGAAYVAETPMFAKGGEKSDWISAKISTLVKEGYPQKQAVAIAYSMYEDMKKENGGFQLPMYQTAGQYNFGNTFAGSNFAKPKFGADPNIQSPEAFSASLDKITEVNPGEYGLGKDPNYVSPLSPESLTAGKDWAAKNPLPQGIEKPMSTNVFGAEVEDSKPKTETTGLQKPDIQGSQPFQFFNPYSGVDIPTAGVMFGQSLENKDTLGAIASGAKVALGTARNILGGMGQARRENYVKNQYAEKQREGMTGQGREQMARFGGYYKDGGMQPGMEEEQGAGQEQQMMQEVAQMLQQGADTQQVIQQLVEMGIPEDQAVQMVQAIMQQMQGSTPQLKRGGMMYYQDGGEDDEDGGEEDEYGEDGYEDEEEPNYMINKPSLMGKQQNFSQPQLAASPAIESAVEATSSTKEEEKEETPSYDKNSARDTWVAKTGMPWSEAKRLGYTTGSAKDNIKLLSELNDPRFNKKYLRSKPLSPAKKKETYSGNPFGEIPKTFAEQLVENFQKLPRETVSKPKEDKPKSPTKNKVLTREQIMEQYKDINPWLTNNPYQAYRYKTRGYLQEGGEYGEGDMVRYGGGNTCIDKKDLKTLAKKYNKTPEEFLEIISYGDVPKGGSMIRMEGGNTGVPANWKEEYKNSKPSTTGFRGVLNKGLDYIGVDPIFNMGGYYQDGGEQQIAQQAAQALQEGAQPEQVMQMLLKSGMTQDQAVQLVQAIMQQVQQQSGSEEGTPQMRRGGYHQEGGMQPAMEEQGGQGNEMEAIMQQVLQMLQQGADPQEVLQMLVEAGVPEDQATQMVQAVMQQMQGGQPQQSTPQMRIGGYYQEGGEEMDEQMEGED